MKVKFSGWLTFEVIFAVLLSLLLQLLDDHIDIDISIHLDPDIGLNLTGNKPGVSHLGGGVGLCGGGTNALRTSVIQKRP